MLPEHIRPNIGESVIFYHRKHPSTPLEGCVVSVLENTIVVEVRQQEALHEFQVEERQVVRHGNYVKKRSHTC